MKLNINYFLLHSDSSRNRLPHLQFDNLSYFITFRLNDAIPLEKENQIKTESLLATKEHEVNRIRKLLHLLDNGYGCCLFKNQICRNILENLFWQSNGKDYLIHAFVIMPNHVHILMSDLNRIKLGQIVGKWKALSQREIKHNKLIENNIWMRDYFDRIVRSPEHFNYYKKYIAENPFKVGLRIDSYSLYVEKTKAISVP